MLPWNSTIVFHSIKETDAFHLDNEQELQQQDQNVIIENEAGIIFWNEILFRSNVFLSFTKNDCKIAFPIESNKCS